MESGQVDISKEDNEIPVCAGMVLADVKVLIQVVDRLFSVGGVKGAESLPIAVVRQKLVSIIERYTET